jgi:hypothetical protein
VDRSTATSRAGRSRADKNAIGQRRRSPGQAARLVVIDLLVLEVRQRLLPFQATRPSIETHQADFGRELGQRIKLVARRQRRSQEKRVGQSRVVAGFAADSPQLRSLPGQIERHEQVMGLRNIGVGYRSSTCPDDDLRLARASRRIAEIVEQIDLPAVAADLTERMIFPDALPQLLLAAAGCRVAAGLHHLAGGLDRRVFVKRRIEPFALTVTQIDAQQLVALRLADDDVILDNQRL